MGYMKNIDVLKESVYETYEKKEVKQKRKWYHSLFSKNNENIKQKEG